MAHQTTARAIAITAILLAAMAWSATLRAAPSDQVQLCVGCHGENGVPDRRSRR